MIEYEVNRRTLCTSMNFAVWGSISYALVRGVIVPFFFPCSRFREVGQIIVMRVSLN